MNIELEFIRNQSYWDHPEWNVTFFYADCFIAYLGILISKYELTEILQDENMES